MIYALAIGVAAFTGPSTSLLSASRVNMPAISMAETPNGMVVPTGLSQLQKDHGKLVITMATTGNINRKERNANLPCSPEEMAEQMVSCIDAGASILHIHSRGEDNLPTMRVDVFRETCRLVKEARPDAIIQISTGGRAGGGYEWRMDPLNLMPEMGSFTPGSVNLGPVVYANDAKLTQDLAQKYCDTGIKPQIEVFDTNMISNTDLLVKQGLLKRPIEYGFVMGAPGAQECSLRQLGHLMSMLQPGDTWTSIGIGKYEMPLAYCAIAMGGHVRVGLEDTNKLPDGRIATNVELVEHVVEVAKAMGREIATPEEAREILSMDPARKDDIMKYLDPAVPLKDLVSPEMWEEHYKDLVEVEGTLKCEPGPNHPNYGLNYEPKCPINGGTPVAA